MKQVTETVLSYIIAAHPGSTVEMRGDKKIVVIPVYDIHTDEAGVIEKEVIPDPEGTRMGILPVFHVREGARSDPEGPPKEGPLGQLYRIIGYTPPKKDDKA